MLDGAEVAATLPYSARQIKALSWIGEWIINQNRKGQSDEGEQHKRHQPEFMQLWKLAATLEEFQRSVGSSILPRTKVP